MIYNLYRKLEINFIDFYNVYNYPDNIIYIESNCSFNKNKYQGQY